MAVSLKNVLVKIPKIITVVFRCMLQVRFCLMLFLIIRLTNTLSPIY